MSSLPTHGDVIRRRLRGHPTNDNSNVDNDAAEDNDDGGGISGPRRGTIQPAPSTAHDDMVADAANAAAMAVAHDIGLMSPSSPAIVAASSTRRGAASTAIDNAPSGASSSGGGIGIRGFLSRRSRSLTGSRSSDDTSTATATTSDFVPLGDDVNPDRHNNDSNTISHSYSKQSSSNHLFIQSSHVYIPPPATTTTNNNTNNNQQQHDVIIKPSPSMISTSADSLTSLHVYDTHGQRAPYYDGPYLITADPDGTRRRRRWYGRLEDGYIAWASIHLFEQFGITVYQPLNPVEMKRGKVPQWMYEFFSLPNIAIPLSYFCIGVALQLLRTPLIVYLIVDRNATPAEVNVLFTVMAVPWCFKVLYGFLSDCIPISGLRRKPYFMAGWVIYVISNLILTITPEPSVGMCISLVFVQTAGYMLADVMTDALIVERSRYESEERRGTMQSQGYIVRFFGSTIGATIGAVVYNKDAWNWYLPINLVFFINAAFPLIMLIPVVPFLMEIETDCVPQNFWDQCHVLFQTVQLRSVWQPMTFVYIYNALQLTNAAWMNFLVEGLNFTAWMIGLVSIAGSIMAWFGIIAYKKYFFASNWRVVYFWCTTLASLIAIGQLILVFGLNKRLGISDIVFSVGDDVLVEFVIAVQFLPLCIMYLGLCPEGSEGTTYAMLTTWSNLAGTIAFDISTALTGVWDVSSEAILAGDYSGVWKLSLFCGILGPIPLVLLGLIPENKEDQRKLQQDSTRHYWAGAIFVTVMILSLFITFAESIYEVCYGDDGQDSKKERRLSRLSVGH